MIRKLALLGAFALTLASFAACGDDDGANGGTGGTGGTGGGWKLDLKPGWCESISISQVSDIVGMELDVGMHHTEQQCTWGSVDAENYGGVTVLVTLGDPRVFDAVRAELEKAGEQIVDVSGIGDKAYFMPGDDETAASLTVLKGNRQVFISAHNSLGALNSGSLVEIANLVYAAI